MSETGAEPQFMRDSIQSAIETWLAENGGGFLNAFVFAAQVVSPDGVEMNHLGGPVEQAVSRSLGLTSYLEKWFDEDARELIRDSKSYCECCVADEDDD